MLLPTHSLERFQALGIYTLPNLEAIQGESIPKLLCFLNKQFRTILNKLFRENN